MTAAARVLLLLTAMTGVAAAGEPAVPAGEQLTPMLRATVFVRDLDESLKLYRDILGLKPRVERTLQGAAVNRILGTEGRTVRLAILQSGDTLTGNVGLFSYDDEQPLPQARSEVRTGDVAFVFITDDIEGLHQRIRAAGYTVVSPPTVLFPEENVQQQGLEMLFFDRDGIGINLIQRSVPMPAAR